MAPQSLGDHVRDKLTFWGMVGVVMTALRLKDNVDEYRKVPSTAEEEEALTGDGPVSASGDRDLRENDDDLSLHTTNLDTSIPGVSRPKRHRRKGCCMCCGVDCSIFWKAIGIVLFIFTLWNGFKLVKWLITPSPTGLEDMPEFSTSLGCLDAEFLYNNSQVTYSVPVNHKLGHELVIQGVAVGTLTLAEGAADATELKYEMTLRSSRKELVDYFNIDYPVAIDESTVDRSRMLLSTSSASNTLGDACMRFDIIVFIPPVLSRLEVKARSTTHIQFDEQSRIDIDELYVTTYSGSDKNIIRPHTSLHSGYLSLEALRGWIVGDISIVDSVKVSTQRGDALANIRVTPTPYIPSDTLTIPPKAKLLTVSGTNRIDLEYLSDPAYPHRPIDSTHMAERNGDIYLTYKDAEYNGFIDVEAKSYSAKNVQGKIPSIVSSGNSPTEEDADRPYHGDKEGGDKLKIKSRKGWVGIYF